MRCSSTNLIEVAALSGLRRCTIPPFDSAERPNLGSIEVQVDLEKVPKLWKPRVRMTVAVSRSQDAASSLSRASSAHDTESTTVTRFTPGQGAERARKKRPLGVTMEEDVKRSCMRSDGRIQLAVSSLR